MAKMVHGLMILMMASEDLAIKSINFPLVFQSTPNVQWEDSQNHGKIHHFPSYIGKYPLVNSHMTMESQFLIGRLAIHGHVQ